MSTKLEAMVGLLAGRPVEPALLDELADPSSEASRFLEATRARSRALLADPQGSDDPARGRPGRGGRIALAALAVAGLVGFAATVIEVDRRFRSLEGRLEARDLEATADARRLEAALGRLAEPRPEWPAATESLRRIEAALGRVRAASDVAEADRSIELVREELAAIRRELSATDRLAAQRSEEVQAAVHDAARVLRLLLNRFDPMPTNPEKPPAYVPPRPPANGDPRRTKP